MSLLARLRSRTAGARISREVLSGLLEGGKRCRALGAGSGMGPLQCYNLMSTTAQGENSQKPTTSSPDAQHGRVSSSACPPLPSTVETSPLLDRDPPPSSLGDQPPSSDDPSVNRTTPRTRPSSHTDIENRSTTPEESSSRSKPLLEPTYITGVQVSESSTNSWTPNHTQNASPSQDDESTSARPRNVYRIVTLDPKQMAAEGQEVSDMSDFKEMCIGVDDQFQWLMYRAPHISRRVQLRMVKRDARHHQPFPPGTKGVLYYHSPPRDRPNYDGQLRFRLCNSLAEFDQGTDLKTPAGHVWGPSLYNIAAAPRLSERFHWDIVTDRLVRDGLVDERVVDHLQRAHRFRYPCHIVVNPRTLYDLYDPFEIDLQGPLFMLALVSPHSIGEVDLCKAFREIDGIHPYTGRILVKFELLPFQEQPTLVIRVLERLTPIISIYPDYKGRIAMPLRGGLIEGRQIKPWTRNHGLLEHYDPFKLILTTATPNGRAILSTLGKHLRVTDMPQQSQ